MSNLYEQNSPDTVELLALVQSQYLGFGVAINKEYTIPNIEGWMSLVELLFLYQQAKKMTSVVEIGCWQGRSTHALASACQGTVYALDHWQGSEGDMSKELIKAEDIYPIFLENTKSLSNIKVIKADANESVKQFEDASIDMVFIDGGHLYADVAKDIKAWLPKTKKLICGHDYSPEFPGVIGAVDETFGKPDGVVGTIWYKVIEI